MDGQSCGGEVIDWQHLLASITGTVDQELLLRNEYWVTEKRILRNQLKGRVRLNDGERQALAEIGYRLGKQALQTMPPRRTDDRRGHLLRCDACPLPHPVPRLLRRA
jgi:hypothetical protein